MRETTSREKILKKIRDCAINTYDNPYQSIDLESNVFNDFTDSTDITFAQEFTKLGGKFIYSENDNELAENLISLLADNKIENICCSIPKINKLLTDANIDLLDYKKDIRKCQAGITDCEFLIARTGGILVSSAQASGRRLAVFPEIHMVVASISQVVRDIKEALKSVQ
ncbi:MAG: LUD domain-containing protein [Bacteroidales bacterium]|nr:LUD domain-containing protein [Bacteroidales bacterium]